MLGGNNGQRGVAPLEVLIGFVIASIAPAGERLFPSRHDIVIIPPV
jgi:hypothetical protein